MARGIWRGAISFGLIHIPVQVMSAKKEEKLHFHMLDKRDFSPIGYRQINKSTGEEVDRKNIVKAFEYQRDQYVVLTDQDFEKANPKATQTIDIEDFVEITDVDPLLFATPYYLTPDKTGEKGYVLLRKTLERTKKAAVAQFVMRKKQHLVAILARGDYLILEILRFAHEIREVKDARFLEDVDLGKVKISERELKMAHQLVEGMTSKWKPEQYKDTYQNDLMKRIQAKAKGGAIETPPEMEAGEVTDTNAADLAALLSKSLRGHKKRGSSAKAASKAPSKAAAKGAHRPKRMSKTRPSARLH